MHMWRVSTVQFFVRRNARSRLNGRSCCSCSFFFFKETAPTEIYTSSHTLSLHDALPILLQPYHQPVRGRALGGADPGNTSVRSEEHTSELQSRELISYAVFCLKKKK